jgi:hypothetical protein
MEVLADFSPHPELRRFMDFVADTLPPPGDDLFGSPASEDYQWAA